MGSNLLSVEIVSSKKQKLLSVGFALQMQLQRSRLLKLINLHHVTDTFLHRQGLAHKMERLPTQIYLWLYPLFVKILDHPLLFLHLWYSHIQVFYKHPPASSTPTPPAVP